MVICWSPTYTIFSTTWHEIYLALTISFGANIGMLWRKYGRAGKNDWNGWKPCQGVGDVRGEVYLDMSKNE